METITKKPKLYKHINEIRTRFTNSGPGRDAKLVAYAREDIEDLLDEIDRLNALLEWVNKLIREIISLEPETNEISRDYAVRVMEKWKYILMRLEKE